MKYDVIKIIIPLIVLLCFGGQYNLSVNYSETKLARAPKVEPKPIIGNYDPSLKPLPPPKTGYDQNIIYSIPDFRSTAGSAGKNIIFAEDGQNVSVIYNRFSGDPTNFMQVYSAYSTDRGNTWVHYGPLCTLNCRRTYPALDAEQNWPDPPDLRIHYAWQQYARIGGYDTDSPLFYAKEVSYPDGLITEAEQLPNTFFYFFWQPCIGVKDSFVLITSFKSGMPGIPECYIWRSTDYGETWDSSRIFIPGLIEMYSPHFRFGRDGYIFFLWNRFEYEPPDCYWPYYCESFDYGLTWSLPQLIWQGTPPYSDMTNVTGSWYDFDCEVVNDTPVATLKFSTQENDYGEIWVYRPTGGSPGNWHFEGTKLVGGDSTAPQTYARYPTLAADDTGNIVVGYQALFILSEDTVWDCGACARSILQNNWYDYGRCTFNGNSIEESYIEFAYNARFIIDHPLCSWGDTIGMIYNNAGDYPTTGNLYFEIITAFYPIIGIPENQLIKLKAEVAVSPNPFRNSVRFTLPPLLGKIQLSIFDATGKLIRELTTKNQQLITDLVWDGKKSNGTFSKPGVYFYNFSSANAQAKGKIILMR